MGVMGATPFGTMGEAASIRDVVLYESKTGRIMHIHRSIVVSDARRISKKELEKASRVQATLVHGAMAQGLQVLHVDAMKDDVTYRVDPKKRCLVRVKVAPPLSGKTKPIKVRQ
jgi:hypothetical protein